MIIAYLTFEYPDNTSGVGKKISSQTQEWVKQGHTAKHFILKQHANKNDDHFMIRRKINNPTLNLLLCLPDLLDELKKYEPDIIYMREVLYIPYLITGMKKICPYILEINSDTSKELKSVSRIKYYYYQFTKQFLFQNAGGIIYISHELKNRFHINQNISAEVIANGYHYVDMQLPNNSNVARSKLNIIFVGSPDQPWHGLDKILRLAELFPQYIFHIVVKNFSCELANIVTYPDGLYGDELNDLYLQCDIGIGSLSLHHKNMNEASPLKTREYIAYNLPIIIGYTDTDIKEYSDESILKISNTPNSINHHKNEIISFINKVAFKKFTRTEIKKILSYEFKEKKRLSFFASLLNSDT